MRLVDPAHSRKVLIVEDDVDTREMMRMLLELNGWVVLTAGTAEEGLDRLSRDEVCVIVLDNRMPGMSGLELLQRLRATGHPARVVFVTGADDVAERVRELQVRYYLRKPVDVPRLLSILQHECETPITGA